jgi:hypothetical protein
MIGLESIRVDTSGASIAGRVTIRVVGGASISGREGIRAGGGGAEEGRRSSSCPSVAGGTLDERPSAAASGGIEERRTGPGIAELEGVRNGRPVIDDGPLASIGIPPGTGTEGREGGRDGRTGSISGDTTSKPTRPRQ